MIEFDSDRIENTAKELIDAIQTPQTIFEEKKNVLLENYQNFYLKKKNI